MLAACCLFRSHTEYACTRYARHFFEVITLTLLLPRQSGRTSLIEATLSNNKELVQMLVEHGADIDVQDVVSLCQRGPDISEDCVKVVWDDVSVV